MFRPAFIQAGAGIRSKTRLYSTMYAVTRPLFPVLRRVAPSVVTDTGRLG